MTEVFFCGSVMQKMQGEWVSAPLASATCFNDTIQLMCVECLVDSLLRLTCSCVFGPSKGMAIVPSQVSYPSSLDDGQRIQHFLSCPLQSSSIGPCQVPSFGTGSDCFRFSFVSLWVGQRGDSNHSFQIEAVKCASCHSVSLAWRGFRLERVTCPCNGCKRALAIASMPTPQTFALGSLEGVGRKTGWLEGTTV